MKRRHLLALLGSTAALGLAGRWAWPRVARPPRPDAPLSDEAQALIRKAWTGLDPARVLDTHVHIVGLGTGGSGCFVNPRLTAWHHPLEYLRFSIYRQASGVDDVSKCDQQYVERLLHLIRSQTPRGRALIFAFDQVHDDDGTPRPDLSEFHVPNDYVLKLARENPDAFVPCASIHPYRADAVDALVSAHAQGAMAVKWLPNAMHIDPSSPKCDPFYEKLVELGVPLITHAGEELAVDAEEAQRLGNPLLLRRALDAGVKVVIAHCASLGDNPDLDAADAGSAPAPVDNFELFVRLMDEPRYQGLLFGDASALPQFNRLGRPLLTMLRRRELADRLVNGSDYPLPAINVLMQTGAIEAKGLLTAKERRLLNEIDQHNPLLFDFVLKRTICLREDGREYRLPDAAFMIRPELFPRLT
jgi:mannonate dehydratase